MKKVTPIAAIFILLAFSGVCLLSPGQVQAGTPDDSYTIERYYNEVVGQQETDSTDYVDAVTITFTPPTNKDYLVIATALTNNDSTSYSTVVKLLEGTTTYSETYHMPVDAALNWRSFSAHKVFSLTGSTSYTFKIQYRTELGDTTATAYIKRATIIAVEVTNYYNAEQESEITTTSATYVTAGTATRTFTPPAADYLILITANLTTDTDANTAYAHLTIDGTVDGTPDDHEVQQSSTTYMSWGAIEKETLDNTEHTIEIQYCTTSETAKIKSARITAVLLTDLGSAQYAESEAESITALDTYQDKTTLSYTPTYRGDHMAIACGLGKQESATYAFYANVDVDSVSMYEYVFVPGGDKVYRSFMSLCKHNAAGGAGHTTKIQYRTSSANPSREAFIKNANVIHTEIDTAESYSDSGHITVSNSFTGAAPNTAYIWAHGLRPSGATTYRVAYYDAHATGGGQKVATDNSPALTTYGNLSSQYVLNTDASATAGTWHAVVFDNEYIPGGGAPSNYSDAAGTAGYVLADSFNVAQAAIPEFPTVFAAIGVAVLCFGTYWWVRKRAHRVC